MDDRGEAEDVTQQANRLGWAATRPPPPPEPARAALRPGLDSEAVVEALRRLPEDQRRAIVLHHLADLSVEQVAARTGAPVSAVRSRLSQARAALAISLHDEGSLGLPAAARAQRGSSTTLEE
jgi:RNA polymerase sigma-70 factor (ECF subfamily)